MATCFIRFKWTMVYWSWSIVNPEIEQNAPFLAPHPVLCLRIAPGKECPAELVMKMEQRHIDNALIERCIRGDQEAWRELVNRYQRLVHSIARLLCPRGDDASDIFQQVWCELYQQLAQLRNVEALPGWLSTVTRRRAYAFIRSRRGSEPIDEEIPDHFEGLRQVEREHMIERALDQLPHRCRTLINFLYFDRKEP